jgi:hypothetical protein
MNICQLDNMSPPNFKLNRRDFIGSQGNSADYIGSNPMKSNSQHAAVSLNDAIKSKHCVQHNYHDHVFDRDGSNGSKAQASKGGVSVPFPQKLYEMLDYVETSDETGLADIIRWQPHGRCFIVRKPKEFADIVLPRFFQQKKYASFQRQLNLYGFNRITKGPDRGSYYHELFLRGKKFLCRGINRIKIKGTGARMASNPDTEPDFYSMPASGTSVPASPVTDTNSMSMMSQFNPQESLTRHSAYMPNLPSYPTTDMNQSFQTNFPSDDLEFVFDGMPFHAIEASRRNSLMSRRDSQAGNYRRNSLITPNASDYDSPMELDDELIFKEMDLINTLGGTQLLSDDEMGQILEKIIA